jgi:2-polyprenyl-6-methoxyphenol hydroxylase-like FAD-dependent oxidoreductase
MEQPAPVLVVGAGPTGLTAAIELARRQVPVRIVDREPGPVAESRALLVQPRTLEIWLEQGVVDDALAAGIPARAARVRLEGADPVDVDLTGMGGPFDAPLVLPQDETEALLVDRLTDLGVEVDRETTLEHLDGQRPRAVLATPDGEQTLEVPWVVGADGAHSTVRDEVGLPFEGVGHPDRFAIADVDADTDLERGLLHAWTREGRLLLVVPLRRPGHYRVITTQNEPTRDPGEPPTREEVQGLVDRVTDARLELAEPRWRSTFQVHCRGVPRYREGRVLLAGDAAHIHSPAGAQGMNTGIQDAHNLAWKLALVHEDLASPSLLDSYHTERHPVGERLLATTDRMFQLVRLDLPGTGWLRRWLARPLLARESVQDRLRGFVSQRRIRYRESPIVQDHRPRTRDPQPGDQVPDREVHHDGRRRRLPEVLAETDAHVLLLVEGTEPRASPSRREAARERFTDRWPGWIGACWSLVHAAPSPSPRSLVDPLGRLHEALGRGSPGYEVIRPDGHLGARADGYEPEPLDAYLSGLAEA